MEQTSNESQSKENLKVLKSKLEKEGLTIIEDIKKGFKNLMDK